MECLSPEQLVAYVRGGGADPRAVEAHVLDCPGCALDLLLAREILGELRGKSFRPATDRLRAAARRRPAAWIPWAVAAGVLIAALVFAVASPRPSAPPPEIVKTPDPVRPKPSPAPLPEVPKEPEPAPKPMPPAPAPPPPPPSPEPRPEPRPEKAPEPARPVPPTPPAPEPEPKKPAPTPAPAPAPAPTLVEKAVVARVIRSVGSTAAAGRVFRAGETVTTARQEYLEVALEGYGQLFFRENSQADLGAAGEITLREGEMLAKMDPGRRIPSLKLPVVQVEPLAPVFNVLATKTSAEISILSGGVSAGSASARGPATMIVKSGKAPEVRALEPGFASWIPDKLAAKKFTGWFEAEEFVSLQGFRVSPVEGSSAGKALVQAIDQAAVAAKIALPFKGKHAVWIRARQYDAKPVMMGVHLNGMPAGEVKLEGAAGKPWRWVGPLVINADRLDLAISALSRWPAKEGQDRPSFPVVIDAVAISSDPSFVPPEKPNDDARVLELGFDEPAGK
jgi:hypothetical protein